MVSEKLSDRKFRLKYGLFSTIDLNFHFIKSNPTEQRGKDSIKWIAPYMDTLLKYALECDHITELGVNQVNSTWAFLKARPKRLVSVDIDLHKRPSQKVREFRGKNYWLYWAQYLAREEGIVFVPVESDDLKIALEETDLMFVDSNHSQSHFRAEMNLHKVKIKKYLIVHDTTMFKRQLMPVIDDLVENREFEIIEKFESSPGLTVLKKL